MAWKNSREVVIACAHSIWNVPPLINAPKVLSQRGWKTTIIGYHSDALPVEEQLADNARVHRLRLTSRKIPIAHLRQPLAVAEFLIKARRLARSIAPSVLVCTNEPASLLLRDRGLGRLKIAWALEFPEFEMMGALERLLVRRSAASWPRADFFVAPTQTRLALSYGLEPELLNRRGFVVHNAPLAAEVPEAASSQQALAALNWLRKERDKKQITLVYAGAVGNRYGINRLIEAVADERSVSLLILGKRHALSEKEVGDAVSGVGGNTRIKWIDEVGYGELAAVLSGADAGFVHYVGDTINTRFSAPGKIYEYLRSGLAIVTDKDCCIANELAAQEVGFFFERPVSRASIAVALRRLVASHSRIRQTRINAKDMFAGEFNLEAQMDGLLEAMTSHAKLES
jgi:glycosyltransferase involved in cell wall biosynthesis